MSKKKALFIFIGWVITLGLMIGTALIIIKSGLGLEIISMPSIIIGCVMASMTGSVSAYLATLK